MFSYTCICLFLKKWWKEKGGIPQKMGKTTYWETERIGQYVYLVPNKIISNQCHLSVVCIASTQY